MKKINKLTTAVVLFSTVLLGSANVVLAADVDSQKSNAEVTFTKGETTDPVDPTDPTDPVKPVDPTTPNTGDLIIRQVPKFDFGTKEITGVGKTYSAKATELQENNAAGNKWVPLYTQVQDKRGTAAGWTLSVKQDDQFKAGTDELTGAKLSFKGSETANTKGQALTNSDTTFEPNGNAWNVLAAAKDSGEFDSIYRLGNQKQIDANGDYTAQDSGALLEVKGASMKAEKYTTTLTWTLSDVPGGAIGEITTP